MPDLSQATMRSKCPMCGRDIELSLTFEHGPKSADKEAPTVRVWLSFDPMQEHIERHKQDPDAENPGIAEIEGALANWSAVEQTVQMLKGTKDDDPYQRGLASGYVGGLGLALKNLRS